MRKIKRLYFALRDRIRLENTDEDTSPPTNDGRQLQLANGLSPVKLWQLNVEESDRVSESILTYLSPYNDPYKFLRLANFDIFSSAQLRTGSGSTLVPPSSCLEYLLRHSNRARLLVNDKRITDLRDEVGYCSSNGIVQYMDLTVFYHPSGLMMYLQHGGRLFSDDLEDPESLKPLAAIFVVLRTNVNLLKSREDSDSDAEDENDSAAPYYRRARVRLPLIVKAVGMVLMTIRKPQLATRLIAGIDLQDPRFVRRHPQAQNGIPLPGLDQLVAFYDVHFPGWQLGRKVPAPLKHTARYCIREALNENWQLPDGIEKLGLPRTLQDYLNLLAF